MGRTGRGASPRRWTTSPIAAKRRPAPRAKRLPPERIARCAAPALSRRRTRLWSLRMADGEQLMTDTILVERDGDIATLTLSNPDRLHAITGAIWPRAGAAMRELSADDDLRCIVLRGAGDKAFDAGADTSSRTE